MSELRDNDGSTTSGTVTVMVLAILHLLAVVIGLLASVFGSMADVSLQESRFALVLGLIILVIGLAGICVSMPLKTQSISSSTYLLLTEIIAFLLLLCCGP